MPWNHLFQLVDQLFRDRNAILRCDDHGKHFAGPDADTCHDMPHKTFPGFFIEYRHLVLRHPGEDRGAHQFTGGVLDPALRRIHDVMGAA